MTDILDKIDASLEEVEEQLLNDYHRSLDAGSSDGFVKLDPGVRVALSEVTDSLHEELQNSGRTSLSLVTERHEVLYSRIAVLRVLFRSHVRVTQLVAARDGIETRRDDLQARVRQERRRKGIDPAAQPEPASAGRFDHKPTQQEIRRNRIGVTAEEEERLGQEQLYLDNGIFSASRELAMLVSLMRGGSLDQPPEESEDTDSPTPAGKAVFQSKDLSYHAPPPERVTREREAPAPAPKPEISKREIAQSPEEIRRKLEARRGESASGPASFGARDLSSHTQNEPPRPRQKEPEPPKPAPPGGRALFESRDLSSSTYSEPPRPRPRAPEPRAETPRPTGKATFAAKDLASHTPSEPPRRREKEAEKKPEAEEKKGPARFESRDLSNSPFPGKD